MINEVTSTKDKSTNMRLTDIEGLVILTDSADIEVQISIADFANRRFVTESILRTAITPESVKNLVLKNGGICRDAKNDCKYLLSKVDALLLQNLDSTCHIPARHAVLGWLRKDGELVFNAFQQYTKDGVADSTYIGSTKIQPCGSVDALVKMFNQTLFDNIPMQAVMAMSAAATVLPFANMSWGTSFYNPINHLVGNSTTGKTSAGYIYTSFGGAPEGNDSLMLSFLGTDNALVNQIGQNKGYPIAIDEFSTGLSRKGWSDFGYTLANGRGKARCKAGGAKVQKIDEFSTVFLTTGEMSILRKCNNNEGLRARIFEYQIEEGWTRSAEESDEIKSVCKRNYGLITPMVAQELLKHGNHWQCCFEGWRKRVRDRIREEKLLLGIGDRIADFVALYMTACEIVGTVLEVEMCIEDVFEFFFIHILVKNAEDANLGTRAYEALISYYAQNKYAYPRLFTMSQDETGKDETFILEEDQEGFVYEARCVHLAGETEYYDCLVFFPDVLERVLLRRGFSDAKVALKAVQKENLLHSKDKHRLYNERMINGVSTRVYMLWINAEW